MKNLEEGFKQSLADSSIFIAYCWLITRIDGVQLGFTSLDIPFQIDGVHYTPFAGFEGSATQQSLDASKVDSQQLRGILSASGISEADLDSGLYQYADVRIFMVNYKDLPSSLTLDPPKHLELPPHHWGESKRDSLGYEVKIKDNLELLNNSIIDETSKICRASLGDDRCRKDLSNLTHALTVTAVESKRVFSVDGNLPDKYFDFGRIQFTSGENNARHLDVGFYFDNKIILSPIPAPFDIAVGDALTAIAGCNGTKLTCITKFQNFHNFIGEPDLPTTDLSVETPSR